MMRLTFLLGTDPRSLTRTKRSNATSDPSHRLAHALTGDMLHVRGMSLRERTDDAELVGECGSRMVDFAAILTDVARNTDDIIFAAALLGTDGTAVAGRRRSGTWTQQPRRLMRLVIEFSVNCAFTPTELVLVAIGARTQTALRLAIRVSAGENGGSSYD